MKASPSIAPRLATLLVKPIGRVFLVLELLITCVLGLAAPPIHAQAEVRPRYEIHATVDLVTASVEVKQGTTFTNWTSRPLSSVVFRLPPAEVGQVADLDVSVPNQAGTASLERAIIEVPLEPPLPPGSSTRVSINYNVSVPRQSGRLGLTSQSIMLGNWFATLGVHRGDWDRRPYTDVGDAFFTEVADFQLEIDTVQPMELAFTGTLVQRIGNHWSIRAENVRDVALVGSSHFTIAQTNVGGITVSAYTLSTDPARLSATAAEMVEWYSARFGAYPYAQLRVVEADLPAAFGGMEYPGLVMLSSHYGPLSRGSAYEALVAHELAHQWFYSWVGSDQIESPWLDEGLATLAPVLFYMDVAPPVGMTQLRVLESTRVTRSIDADLYTFDDDSTYFAAVYRPGARMLWELREAMGEATFDLALRDYITTFAHRTATPRSLLDLLQRHTDVKLNPIVNRYVTYGAFTYPQAQLWSASLVDTSLLVSTPLRILADFPIGPIEVWLDSQLLVSTDLGGDQDGIVMLDLRGSPRGEHVLLTKIWNSELAQFEQAIRVTVR